jgi:hypothetical protein
MCPWWGVTKKSAQNAGHLVLKGLAERGFTLDAVAETPGIQ